MLVVAGFDGDGRRKQEKEQGRKRKGEREGGGGRRAFNNVINPKLRRGEHITVHLRTPPGLQTCVSKGETFVSAMRCCPNDVPVLRGTVTVLHDALCERNALFSDFGVLEEQSCLDGVVTPQVCDVLHVLIRKCVRVCV
jgi:hypothetical protein